MTSTMGLRNRRSSGQGSFTFGTRSPKTPKTPASAVSSYSVYSGYSGYSAASYDSYGSWEAYMPRTWAASSPALSPSMLSWPLASPGASPEMAVAVPALSPGGPGMPAVVDRQRQAEHDYLFEKLRSRDGSIRRKLERLATAQAELQRYNRQKEQREKKAEEKEEKDEKEEDEEKEEETSTTPTTPATPAIPKITRGQARDLRRQLWWLQHQIQDVERDEDHLVAHIGEIMADGPARQWLAQARQQRFQEYGQHADWLAQAVTTPSTATAHYSHFPFAVQGRPANFDDMANHPVTQAYLQAILEAGPLVPGAPGAHAAKEASKTPSPTVPGAPVLKHLTLDSSFVVSPVTPGFHPTIPASPVSVSAVSAALVGGEHRGPSSSPMSPLAPVFRPRASSTATRASDVGFLGMHYAREQDAAVFHDDDEDKETADSDVSDTSFLPPDARTRRLSHSAASPTQSRQKRMSLPLVHFTWPEREEK